MQIPLGRYDENVIGPDVQPVRDQLNRHRGISRKDFMELGGDDPEVINDDHSNTKIDGQMSQQPNVGIEAAG